MKYNDLKIQNEISQKFQEHYRFKINSIDFIPVGEESYAYVISADNGKKYFAKYSESIEVSKNIDRINELLFKLKELPFVVPSIDSQSQSVLNGKMYVYPYIEGETITLTNRKFDKDLVHELTKMMAMIHNTNIQIDLPEETFTDSFNERLEKINITIKSSNVEKNIQELFNNNEKIIRTVIQKHHSIADKYLKLKPKFVLTHGDITGLNIIKSSGGIKLVDWDWAMFAPVERDINFLFDNPNFSLDEYLSLSHQKKFQPELKEYYSNDWALGSIIGNFESILDTKKAKENKSEYIEEINEYLNYYK